jgi:hypothetical protein
VAEHSGRSGPIFRCVLAYCWEECVLPVGKEALPSFFIAIEYHRPQMGWALNRTPGLCCRAS